MLVGRHLPAKAGDTRDAASVLQLGRSPGGWNGNPLQYSCLENPMGREACQTTVHGSQKIQTQLNMHMLLFFPYLTRNSLSKGTMYFNHVHSQANKLTHFQCSQSLFTHLDMKFDTDDGCRTDMGHRGFWGRQINLFSLIMYLSSTIYFFYVWVSNFREWMTGGSQPNITDHLTWTFEKSQTLSNSCNSWDKLLWQEGEYPMCRIRFTCFAILSCHAWLWIPKL